MLELQLHHTQQGRLTAEVSEALIKLLADARNAMSIDLDSADRCIERATQLLRPGGVVVPFPSGGLAPWQLRRVREHIAANLSDTLPIERLAALVRLSAGHFARAFKASMGVSPHAYIINQRLERAREMMLATREPLCAIALACGFADQTHMTRLFTRHKGRSPAAWRRVNVDYACA
jgi:transcriptional regulator GlxA family with amidase domain